MVTDPGIEFYDVESERRMKYVYPIAESSVAGWILYWHPYGENWVALRKATDDDLTAINKAVSEGYHAEQ